MKRSGIRRAAVGWGMAVIPAALGLAAPPVPAQAPGPEDTLALHWNLSETVVRAGERLVLRAAAPIPGTGWRLAGPPPGGIGPIDILASGPASAEEDSSAWVVELALFELGEVDLSGIPFRLDGGGAFRPAMLRDARVLVEATVPDSASVEDLRDIKGPLGAPVRWRWGRVIAAALAMAALAGAFVAWRRRRERRPEPVAPYEPTRSPEDLALSALRELEREALPRRGLVKEHYFRLSGILRRYVEDRFRMPAVESTTWEIRTSLESGTGRAVGDPGALLRILEESDLVKFAKMDPGPEAAGRAVGEARAWVEKSAAASPAREEPDAIR